MRNNHKNAMLALLLGALVVMAVGYAAFSTALQINGTASIDSSWNVQFDTTKTSGTGVIKTTMGTGGSTAPSGGTIAYPNVTTANLTATLKQPGDSVEYTLTVKNTGSLAATLSGLSMTSSNGSCTGSGSSTVCTSSGSHIRFTIGNFSSTSLAASSGTATIKVTATFVDAAVTSLTSGETITVQVTFNATQASS